MDATTLENLAKDVAAANESQLLLHIAGVDPQSVTFLNFKGENHGLSQDYRFNFNIELVSPLDLSKVIGSAAYFEVTDNNQPVYIHGIITEVTFLGSRVDGESYYVSMNSMLFPLKHNIQNRVFLNQDVKQIIQVILEDAKFNNAEFEFKTKGEYAIREFTVQYDESDFEFISRLMAYEGLFYTFEQKADGAKLLIYDDIADIPAFELGELMYETQSGAMRGLQTIYTLNRRAQMVTDNIKLKDYNYRTPEANLGAASTRAVQVQGQGTDYRYGENYKTLDDGDRISRLRQQALDWQREVYIADTDCRALIPGQKFTLTSHPNEALNGDYYIYSIEHQGDESAALPQGSLVSGVHYKATLILVKAGVPYRSEIPAPRYHHGVFTAKVETTGSDYAYLDEQGRYHVRMPFDLSMAAEGEASHPVRQAQTYSGMEYGMHFPLHAGTEVILTSVNGDLDRPVMLGALHNPELPNLVTSSNNSNNLLRSWGDNELLMEDFIDKERIDLFTRERKNSLRLDAKADGHKVYLGTEEGEMEQYAAKTMLIESGDTQTVQSGNDHILTIENSYSLHTEKKQIEFKAKTDIRAKAGKNIFMKTSTENLEMKAGKDMVIDVNNNMSLEVRNKNLNIVCKNGNFEIKAAKAITVKGQGGGNINISQAGGSVVIDTGGAISIKGNTVNIDGNSVYLKGATAKEGNSGGAGGASGSDGGKDISKLSLAALDVFQHQARTAQDIATTINSPTAKEGVQGEDLTVDQVNADVVTGGAKQLWNEIKCKAVGQRAEWFAENSKSGSFTDKETGKDLTPSEVGERYEQECLSQQKMENTDQEKGAKVVKDAPETAAAVAAITALGTKGRSVVRDPKDFAKDMKKGMGGDKKKSTDNKKKDKEKKCEYKLSATKKCSKPANKTCPLKNKNKRKNGDNKGNSSALARNIMKNLTGKTDIKNHDWYYKPSSIAAHHIIVSESVSGSKWKTYFDVCGYDINHHNNGVMLPMTLEAACQIKVPLHKSNHSAGIAKNRGGISYVKAVKDTVSKIETDIRKNIFCSNPKGLENDMNDISESILQYIDHYIWTLTADGDDYAPVSQRGCANVEGIPEKSGNTEDCHDSRLHQLRQVNTNKLLVKNGPLKVGA